MYTGEDGCGRSGKAQRGDRLLVTKVAAEGLAAGFRLACSPPLPMDS